MDLILYSSTALPNKLNKTTSLTALFTDTAAQLVGPVNDDEPKVQMSVEPAGLNTGDINYMKLDTRYYFVTSVDRLANGLVVVNGSLDVLMTYRSKINALPILVARSTNLTTGRIEDPLAAPTVDTDRVVTAFPTQIDDTETGGRYVLITTQAGYTPV